MRLETRKLLDRAFSGLGGFSIALMAASLVVILAPIFVRGLRAFVFRATVEHRRMVLETFERGDRARVQAEVEAARQARQPVYDILAAYRKELKARSFIERRKAEGPLGELETCLHELLGPFPGEPRPVLPRQQYGQTRWDRAQVKLHDVLFTETYDYSDPARMGKRVLTPRVEEFKGTALEPLFAYVEGHAAEMLRPRIAFYWRFLTDESRDSHFFGGIWPELLGTVYLTVGAILFAVPMGIIAAI
jgi:phosphate transport system permease protein